MFIPAILTIARQHHSRKRLDGNSTVEDGGENETSPLLPTKQNEKKNRSWITKDFHKVFIIPQRYILGIMGTLAIVNSYTMRVSLSVAITEMVNSTRLGTSLVESECIPEGVNRSAIFIRQRGRQYDWDNEKQGIILSSFYYGYVLTHLPGGILAEKFGGKYSLGLGILATAIFTCITPFVLYATDGNWIYFVILRIIVGLGEGTTFPALNALLAKWVPLRERATIGTLVYAGSQIGTIVANAVSGALIDAVNDWASVFYLFGVLGILWTALWTLLCYSDPERHPYISDKEKAYLDKEIKHVSSEKVKIPWRGIFTSKPLWALVIAQIGHDWGFFMMITNLPTYMKEVLSYDVKENGYLSALPYVVMWIVSMSSGWFCDWLVHKKKLLSVGRARKIFTSIAGIGPAAFIVAASYSGCNRTIAVVMFTLGMGLMGTFYCGMKVNALDLSPNFAGTLMAIVNGIGAITGMVVPYLASALTKNHTVLEWRLVFWITFGALTITTLVFAFFGSADVQVWNEGRDVYKRKRKEEQNELKQFKQVESDKKANGQMENGVNQKVTTQNEKNQEETKT